MTPSSGSQKILRDSIRLTTPQLYYNKRSQFLSGVEAEKVDVSVGQNVKCHPYSPGGKR